MPLIKKQIPSFVRAISIPAIDGPSNLAALTIEEFKAIALARYFFFSTISIKNDWRAGVSQALIEPSNKLKSMICQIMITPVKKSNANSSACTIKEPG